MTNQIRRWLRRTFSPVAAESLTFVAVDIETTGLDPAHNYITEIGWQCVRGGTLMRNQSYVVKEPVGRKLVDNNDLCRMNAHNAASTNAYPIDEVIAALAADANSTMHGIRKKIPLAFHNASFDVSFIVADMAKRKRDARWLFEEAAGPFSRYKFDTQALIQPLILNGEIPSQSLAKLCEALGVKPGDHTAGEDARATAECLIQLFDGGWI